MEPASAALRRSHRAGGQRSGRVRDRRARRRDVVGPRPATAPAGEPRVGARPGHDLAAVGTRRWLESATLTSHHHVRRGNVGDLARLGRLLSGRGTSLVLGGGGARGLRPPRRVRGARGAGPPDRHDRRHQHRRSHGGGSRDGLGCRRRRGRTVAAKPSGACSTPRSRRHRILRGGRITRRLRGTCSATSTSPTSGSPTSASRRTSPGPCLVVPRPRPPRRRHPGQHRHPRRPPAGPARRRPARRRRPPRQRAGGRDAPAEPDRAGARRSTSPRSTGRSRRTTTGCRCRACARSSIVGVGKARRTWCRRWSGRTLLVLGARPAAVVDDGVADLYLDVAVEGGGLLDFSTGAAIADARRRVHPPGARALGCAGDLDAG